VSNVTVTSGLKQMSVGTCKLQANFTKKQKTRTVLKLGFKTAVVLGSPSNSKAYRSPRLVTETQSRLNRLDTHNITDLSISSKYNYSRKNTLPPNTKTT